MIARRSRETVQGRDEPADHRVHLFAISVKREVMSVGGGWRTGEKSSLIRGKGPWGSRRETVWRLRHEVDEEVQ